MRTIPMHETPEGSKPVDWSGLCEQYSVHNKQLRKRIDQLLAALKEIELSTHDHEARKIAIKALSE